MMHVRRLAAALVAVSAIALAGASSAEAKYCGKVRAYRVDSTGVPCSTARTYIRRNRCPAGFKRFRVTEEFGFEVIGYGCRRGKRHFTGTSA